MELGLRLGDPPPLKGSATAAATVSTTVGVNTGMFCMALGLNPTGHQQDDHDDRGPYEEEEEDEDDEEILREKGGIMKDVITVGSQRICSVNPPVQLDLLPSEPVPRHTSLPWSSGSSEGGSSGNHAAVGRGVDIAKMLPGTEEATSSFRLDFSGSENHKRGFDIGNDAVGVERGSCRAISEEDEHGMTRKKLRLSKEQSAYLEESFKEHNTLNPKQKLALAEQLNLRPRQVEVWFQNRRARTKLKQTEVDFEYLKRCCETLTDENRRLHKELQELRALKTTSNPFYMQPPPTTLTMCPSCERTVPTTTSTPPPSTTTTLTPPSNLRHQTAEPS